MCNNMKREMDDIEVISVNIRPGAGEEWMLALQVDWFDALVEDDFLTIRTEKKDRVLTQLAYFKWRAQIELPIQDPLRAQIEVLTESIPVALAGADEEVFKRHTEKLLFLLWGWMKKK